MVTIRMTYVLEWFAWKNEFFWNNYLLIICCPIVDYIERKFIHNRLNFTRDHAKKLHFFSLFLLLLLLYYYYYNFWLNIRLKKTRWISKIETFEINELRFYFSREKEKKHECLKKIDTCCHIHDLDTYRIRWQL